MNTENSKANELHRFKLDLTDNVISIFKEKYGFTQFKYLIHLEKHQVKIQKK